ncbi:TetR/AcrR family transcriptional regulator [Idiomarina sp. X4]|jgi:AcrR family transcriptional regulator|uniref:TetR/AcrR family transcriptional regulator n=1 Tax=unclassified Idiomarina TaxID=2614829 RepID=UPI000C28D304|nr:MULTISPECIES: TetR/AcrR family transcriptional regulator [unclassified Idiomarina]ATZ72849.1 TetR/AcrR family transcriptional regulator [Idiomarina sp. X4]RXS43158.1 TetR/AcrR family transcriptional regulator [Idiomarina sp. 29L]
MQTQNDSQNKVGRPSNKALILDAADSLVASEGASHLTFDALSQKTGISKGGLLYHFANKDALLQAMLQRRVERFESLRKEHLKRLDSDPNKAPKSILLAALDTDAECARLGSGMLAAAASNPELLEPLKRHVNDTIKQMEQHLGEQVGRMLFYSVHGARLFEQLNLCEQCVTEREQFAEYLLNQIDKLTETHTGN